MPEQYILVIAPEQIDDLLFLQALGRALGQRGALPPMVIVHGSGEQAERRLEGEGGIVRREQGRLVVHSEEEVRMVEQAIRASNRKLVSVLNDAVVHAVGFQGTDRGLLHQSPNGGVAANAGWLERLMRQGAVPVVASWIRGRDGTLEADPAAAALALYQNFESEAAVVLFARAGKTEGSETEADFRQIVASGILPNPELAEVLVQGGAAPIVSAVTSFLTEQMPHSGRVVT